MESESGPQPVGAGVWPGRRLGLPRLRLDAAKKLLNIDLYSLWTC